MVDGDRTRRATENGHVSVVTTELADVFPHPLQRCDLIQQAIVAQRAFGTLFGERRVCEPASTPEAVIDGHHDRALLGEPCTVMSRTRAGGERAAVNPHHYRKLGTE